ncbi:MAG: protein-export chaperone SecB, partial [Alphaproteobacteria bacterium]|nr:protein-export chaperone SecB [Alphaproteobacteria bacterium]
MPAPAPESGQDENAPRLQILAQYVRDLSFENPGAPNFRLPEGEQPEMKI